jgi:L-fucose isomerase-like protein
MHRPRIGCYVVYEPPEEGWQNWQTQFESMNSLLSGQGIDVIPVPEAVCDADSTRRVTDWFKSQALDGLHALIITWSFDHYTIELQKDLALPIAIRAIPGIRTGSIVGSQQLSCVLSDLGVPHKLFYGSETDNDIIEQTSAYLKACGIWKQLRTDKIGMIGRRTEGMTPTAVDEVEILRLFGTRMVHLGLDELNELASQIPAETALETWKSMSANASAVISKTEFGTASAKNFLACKQYSEKMNLSALTVGSYPICQGTMCVPIAWLNETGIVTGCEGDVNSTLSMLILSKLSSAPVHFGEMLDVNEQENTVVTSHCGCGSPSLAGPEGYSLQPVRLANNGVCIRYSARPGPVTYVNLVGRKGNYRLLAFEGEAVPTEMVFEGNPLKFILKSPFRKIWDEISEHGFGHHWMTAYGHFNRELYEFCKLIGIKGFFPDINKTLQENE